MSSCMKGVLIYLSAPLTIFPFVQSVSFQFLDPISKLWLFHSVNKFLILKLSFNFSPTLLISLFLHSCSIFIQQMPRHISLYFRIWLKDKSNFPLESCLVDMSFSGLPTALPENKAKTENTGLKHKYPCTFQSATTLQNAHTGFNRLEKRRTLLKWRDKDRPNNMKDQLWTLSGPTGTFLYLQQRDSLTYFSTPHCVLCTKDTNGIVFVIQRFFFFL